MATYTEAMRREGIVMRALLQPVVPVQLKTGQYAVLQYWGSGDVRVTPLDGAEPFTEKAALLNSARVLNAVPTSTLVHQQRAADDYEVHSGE